MSMTSACSITSVLHGHPTESFPFLDLQAQFSAIRDEVVAAVTRVLDSQQFILGHEVSALEQEIAAYIGVRYAIGCASGSDALLLALMALGVGPGEEVITTPFTFGATAGAIARLQAKPVFVDIDPATYNIDPCQILAAISPKTRAIIPVHLFGQMADMTAIASLVARTGLPVVEDAAQAIGAKCSARPAGSFGAFGCFSFFPSKNLGGAGDGGLVTTNDADLAERVRTLRVHGSRSKYTYDIVGMNSRLDALQATILRVKLRYLPVWTAARQANAIRYTELFAEYSLHSNVQLPITARPYEHVYNQFVIRAPERDALRSYLKQHGIPTEIYYPFPLHLQPAYSQFGYHKGDFPNAERACNEVLALPIFAELTEAQQRVVVETIADFYRG